MDNEVPKETKPTELQKLDEDYSHKCALIGDAVYRIVKLFPLMSELDHQAQKIKAEKQDQPSQ